MEVMHHAMNVWPAKYGLDEHVLGPMSKLYIRKKYNAHDWVEVDSSETLKNLLYELMENKSRVKEKVLNIELTLSALVANDCFTDGEEVCIQFAT